MRFEFESKIEDLAVAMGVIDDSLKAAGCSDAVRNRLMIALDEVASNIIRYSGAPTYAVEIEFPENPESVLVSFSDAGRPFNPLEEAPPPDLTSDLKDRPIGGLGMHLVKRLMDNVSYQCENGLNVLTIRKLREA